MITTAEWAELITRMRERPRFIPHDPPLRPYDPEELMREGLTSPCNRPMPIFYIRRRNRVDLREPEIFEDTPVEECIANGARTANRMRPDDITGGIMIHVFGRVIPLPVQHIRIFRFHIAARRVAQLRGYKGNPYDMDSIDHICDFEPL